MSSVTDKDVTALKAFIKKRKLEGLESELFKKLKPEEKHDPHYWMMSHLTNMGWDKCWEFKTKVDNEGTDYYYHSYADVENVEYEDYRIYTVSECWCDHRDCPGGCDSCEDDDSKCKLKEPEYEEEDDEKDEDYTTSDGGDDHSP